MPSPNTVEITIKADAAQAIAQISSLGSSITKLQNASNMLSVSLQQAVRATVALSQPFEDHIKKSGLLSAAIQHVSDTVVASAASFTNLRSALEPVIDWASRIHPALSNVASAVATLASGWNGLVAAVLGGAITLVEIGNSFTVMAARLSAVTGSATETQAALNEIIKISKLTGLEINHASEIYTRASATLRALGYSAEESASFIEKISIIIRAQTNSTKEAREVTMQFAQALAQGVLRGDEFNTVMERAPLLAKLIAENWQNVNGTFGISVLQLRQMAEQGQLTADRIVAAIQRAGPQVNEVMGNMSNSVSVAWGRLVSAAVDYAVKMDQTLGISKLVAQAINSIADNFQLVVGYLQVAGGLFLATFGGVPGMIAGVALAINGLKEVISAAFGAGRKEVDETKLSLEDLNKRIQEAQLGLAATLQKLAVEGGKAIEAVDAAIGKIKERIDILKDTYDALAGSISSAYAAQLEAIKTQSSIAVENIKSLMEQMKPFPGMLATLYQEFSRTAISSIEQVYLAKLDKSKQETEIARQQAVVESQTAQERAARLREIERQSLLERIQLAKDAFDQYKALYDQLTEKARLHFENVRRLWEEQTNIVERVDKIINEIRDRSLTDEERRQKQFLEAEKELAEAREALAQGNYEKAKEYTENAIRLYTELGKSSEVESYEETKAIEGLKKAREQYLEILNNQAAAEEAAGNAAVRAADEAKAKMQELSNEIDEIASKLEQEFQVRVVIDQTAMDVIKEEINQLVADRDVLVKLKLDMQEEQRKLQEAVENIKAGDVPVGLKAELERFEQQLEEAREVAKKYDAEIALKITGVEQQVEAAERQLDRLNNLKTQSEHLIRHNTDEVKQQILALDGLNTSSTHTIYVKKVETDYTGGLIGDVEQIPFFGFAGGGYTEEIKNHKTIKQLAGFMKHAGTFEEFFKSLDKALYAAVTAGENVDKVVGDIIEFFKNFLAAFGEAVLYGTDYRRYPVDPVSWAIYHIKNNLLGNVGKYWPIGYASGGWVPGIGSSDTVPAVLEPGSFVLRKSAARRFRRLLSKISLASIKTGWGAATKGIRALLTPGEFVVPRHIVKKLGVSTLYMMNRYGDGGHVDVEQKKVVITAPEAKQAPVLNISVTIENKSDEIDLRNIFEKYVYPQLRDAMRRATA